MNRTKKILLAVKSGLAGLQVIVGATAFSNVIGKDFAELALVVVGGLIVAETAFEVGLHLPVPNGGSGDDHS